MIGQIKNGPAPVVMRRCHDTEGKDVLAATATRSVLHVLSGVTQYQKDPDDVSSSLQTSGGVSRAMKSLDPLYSQISLSNIEPGDKDLDLKGDDDSPQPGEAVTLTCLPESVALTFP